MGHRRRRLGHGGRVADSCLLPKGSGPCCFGLSRVYGRRRHYPVERSDGPGRKCSVFWAGTSLWALALVLISVPRVFPLPVRLLGLFAALLFGATAGQIFAGAQVMPTTSPLPFFAYPVLAATLVGWIWTLVNGDRLLAI